MDVGRRELGPGRWHPSLMVNEEAEVCQPQVLVKIMRSSFCGSFVLFSPTLKKKKNTSTSV